MKLAFDVTGSGDPLVLVHGIAEDRNAWREIARMLAAHYEIFSVDLRGHGESAKQRPYDLQTLATDIEDLGIHDPFLIGHSLGGAIVTMIGARATINLDQPLRFTDLGPMIRSVAPQLRGPDFRQILIAQMDALGGPALPADLRDELLRYRKGADQDVVLDIWEPLLTGREGEMTTIIEAALAKWNSPYLSLHGNEPGDSYRDWLLRHRPMATVEAWPAGGHWLHRLEPRRFIERAESFFERARP